MAIQPIPSFLPAAPSLAPQPREQVPVATEINAEQQNSTTPPSVAQSEGSAPTSPATQPSREQIDQAMKEVKQALPFQARDLQFSIDNDTGRTVIKVVDPTTKEVIRQMPSEELLAITKALDKFTGLLVKQKA